MWFKPLKPFRRVGTPAFKETCDAFGIEIKVEYKQPASPLCNGWDLGGRSGKK